MSCLIKTRDRKDYEPLDGSELAEVMMVKLEEEQKRKDLDPIENVSCYEEMFYNCK